MLTGKELGTTCAVHKLLMLQANHLDSKAHADRCQLRSD